MFFSRFSIRDVRQVQIMWPSSGSSVAELKTYLITSWKLRTPAKYRITLWPNIVRKWNEYMSIALQMRVYLSILLRISTMAHFISWSYLKSFLYTVYIIGTVKRLTYCAVHGLSQPAVFWTVFINFRRPLEKDGFWGGCLLYWRLLINFMMARWPQLAKQSLHKIYPLPFNVSYFLDNIYR